MQWRWPLVQQVSRLKAAGAMKEEGRDECGGPALYEDPDFRCVDASLFSGSSTPLARLQGDITWLRPQVSLSSGNAQKIPYWLSFHWSGVVIDKILPHRAWHLWPISLCRLTRWGDFPFLVVDLIMKDSQSYCSVSHKNKYVQLN